MAIITYPLNDIDYDASAAELYNSTRTSGVYAMNDNLNYSISGRTITISPGMAWMKTEAFTGKAVGVTEPVALSVAAADTVLSRIDRIVLQFSKSANNTQLIIKQGEPASSPQAPARSATESLYELVLYDVSVPAGSSQITDADITDQRGNPALCGLMTDGVTREYGEAPPSHQVLVENSITLGLEHANKQLVVTATGNITITVPCNVFQDYTEIEVLNAGDGTITFKAELGANFISTSLSSTPVLAEYGASACLKLLSVLGSNVWALQGAIQ